MKKKLAPRISEKIEKIQDLVVKAQNLLSEEKSSVEIIRKIENASELTKLLRRKILGIYIKTCFKNLNKARKDKEIIQITKELLVINNKLNH